MASCREIFFPADLTAARQVQRRKKHRLSQIWPEAQSWFLFKSIISLASLRRCERIYFRRRSRLYFAKRISGVFLFSETKLRNSAIPTAWKCALKTSFLPSLNPYGIIIIFKLDFASWPLRGRYFARKEIKRQSEAYFNRISFFRDETSKFFHTYGMEGILWDILPPSSNPYGINFSPGRVSKISYRRPWKLWTLNPELFLPYLRHGKAQYIFHDSTNL